MILPLTGTASEEFAPLTLLGIVKNCSVLRPTGQPPKVNPLPPS